MTTNHKPATALPFVLFDPHSGEITKDWTQIPHGALSNKLSLEEKREIVRRTNTYPHLIKEREELVKQLEHINRHRDPRECEEIEADRDLLEKENARLREALRSNIFSVHLIAFESGYRSRERNENLQEGLAKARAALAKAKP